MKTAAIIPARLASNRLPGKALLPILDKPVIHHIVDRLRASGVLNMIIFAVANEWENRSIVEVAQELGCGVYIGDPEDVMGRTLAAAQLFNVSHIVDISRNLSLLKHYNSHLVVFS